MAFKNPTPGFVLDNKYRLAERIGGGGMGDVFRAEHMVTSRSVAIKFLHPELVDNAELSQRFFQEAQAVNRIRHPNIVDVLDAGVSDLGPYIVMEHLDGESVGTALARFGRFEVDAVVGTAIPVLEALDAAHRAGIIHRDLKPENVFIAFDASKGVAVVRLLDFGIAKVLDSDGQMPRTRTGVVFGTPDYLSPEQATGESSIDGRSDLFAVGVLMYELLTGTRPFRAATAVATAFKVVHTEAPTISAAGVHVDPRLEAAVQRLLQKDPSARFATASDVARELERIVPDVTKRVSSLGRIINVPRRLAMLSTQGALTGLGGGYGSQHDSGPVIKESIRPWSGSSAFGPPPIAASSTRPALRMSSPRLSDPGPSPRSDAPRISPRLSSLDDRATRANVGELMSQARGSDPPAPMARPVSSIPPRSAEARSNSEVRLLSDLTPSAAKVQVRPFPARFAGKYQVRGPVLRSVDRSLGDSYGKAKRDIVVGQLPTQYANEFRHGSINALVGYELEALDAYMEIATSIVLPDTSTWRQLGRQAVGGELLNVLRTLLRPSTDLLALIRRGVSTWSRLFTFGSWRVAKSPSGRVSLQISEFDPASLPLRLWVVGMIEETACRATSSDVKVTITLGELGFTPDLAIELG
ncbi:MAG TPA: protein kinase [Polyangiaceae bacterium]|jgi:serine/threonine-protein kinase|nr:protein kinase [Polyangiaceae bacterium]